MTLLLIFLGLLCSVMADTEHDKKEPDIKGMTRSPENGLVKLNQVMKCFLDGQEPEDLQWVQISDDGSESVIVSDEDILEYKAVNEDVTYRCKTGTYVQFLINSLFFLISKSCVTECLCP